MSALLIFAAAATASVPQAMQLPEETEVAQVTQDIDYRLPNPNQTRVSVEFEFNAEETERDPNRLPILETRYDYRESRVCSEIEGTNGGRICYKGNRGTIRMPIHGNGQR